MSTESRIFYLQINFNFVSSGLVKICFFSSLSGCWLFINGKFVMFGWSKSEWASQFWKQYISSVTVTPGMILWICSQGLRIAMKGRILALSFEKSSSKVNQWRGNVRNRRSFPLFWRMKLTNEQHPLEFSFINGSTALCWALVSSSVSLITFTQTVGILGRVTSPSQGRYLHPGQHNSRFFPHSFHLIISYHPVIWGFIVRIIDTVINSMTNKTLSGLPYDSSLFFSTIRISPSFLHFQLTKIIPSIFHLSQSGPSHCSTSFWFEFSFLFSHACLIHTNLVP
jgi:hypothetical protein